MKYGIEFIGLENVASNSMYDTKVMLHQMATDYSKLLSLVLQPHLLKKIPQLLHWSFQCFTGIYFSHESKSKIIIKTR